MCTSVAGCRMLVCLISGYDAEVWDGGGACKQGGGSNSEDPAQASLDRKDVGYPC